MLPSLKSYFVDHKTNLTLVSILVLLLVGGFFGYQKFLASKNNGPVQEVDLSFNPDGPYALLAPRRDGNALVLDLKRTADYDSISYELAYVSLPDQISSGSASQNSINSGDGETGPSSGIDRGVVGNINTHDKKSEYNQEILFGTCSKNICKYDKGVENGTLTLHIRKGGNAYRMVTQWHLQQPDVALGNLNSGDGHFIYSVPNAPRQALALIGYSIINDLTGVPKLPDGKDVQGKAYALNLPPAKELMPGQVSIELADKPPANAQIGMYSDQTGQWQLLDTKINGGTLLANASGAGIFAALVDKK